MEILKFGLIGFLVFIPFLLVGQITLEHYESEQKTIRFLEEQIEEASYDAAFAMKTYTRAFFDSGNVYNIDVDYQEVVHVFEKSLEFRKLPIGTDDFSGLIFVGYDGIVLYNPSLNEFLPKVYYSQREGLNINYYNMSNTCFCVDIQTKEVTLEPVRDIGLRNQVIIEALEEALERNESVSDRDLHIDYLVPQCKSSLFKQGVADMAFIPLFESQAMITGKRIAFYHIAPSGVMKIHQESISIY